MDDFYAFFSPPEDLPLFYSREPFLTSTCMGRPCSMSISGWFIPDLSFYRDPCPDFALALRSSIEVTLFRSSLLAKVVAKH